MIWNREYSVAELNEGLPENIATLLGIEFSAITENSLSATMPVDTRTHQPYGILHGGASVVLAESIGSTASNLIIDNDKFIGVGLEVNANHLRPVKDGIVTGVCTAVHIGAKTHVWDIRIHDKRGKLSCISRLTVAIVPKP